MEERKLRIHTKLKVMNTKEKINQLLEGLSEKELERVEQLVEEIKSKKGHRTKYLRTHNLGGKYDQVNIRDAAYE